MMCVMSQEQQFMEDSHFKTGDSSHQEVDDAFDGFNTVHTQENIY